MTTPMTCPKCSSADVRFRPKLKDWTCFECGHNWTAEAPVEERRPLHIFLSYGHDEHTASALRIKADLEARGHKVWFDAERLREGRDWEQYIEEGLRQCDKVVLLMTPHSVRRRNPRDPESRDGYCLNEIAKAIEKNKLIVPVMLVTLDDGPPTSICRIQYLDLRDCVPIAGNDERYKVRLERLAKAVEQDDLDFEGGQARLQRLLRPLSFEAEMSRHIARFTGRQWLVAEIDRWLAENPASRVFWLSGPPGIGKSAMATHLVHRRGDVIGYHLCVHGHDDKGDPSRAVLSLAYQVAQHLPEYDKALKALDLEQEVGKHAGTLFDNLFVKPLGGNFPAPEGPRLLVIDAIDEATRGGRNEIAELVRDHWEEVPSWLRLVITSRPEVEVVATLGHLKPFVLDAQRRENLEDLRRYLDRELAERKLPRDARTIDTILAASEAVFLYVVVLLEEIDQGRMSLSRLDDLPVGLAGHYQRFFSRQYPDGGEYRAAIAPLLECICAAREPLPLDVLARAAGLGGNEVRARLVRVGSMFPIRQAPNQEDTIRPFHKSVADWLTALHENTRLPRAGAYFVDVEAGEKRLADACWAECRRDVQSASVYSLRYLPAHLVAVGRGGDAAEVMTEFGYQYQRLKVLGREDVVNVTTDFALVDGAAGLVPAVRGRLGVWRAFHAENAHILRREDALPQTSLLQRAVAHADTSPVTEGAERWLEQVGSEGQWLRPLGRPHERERSACLRTLEGHTAHVNAVAPLPDGRRALSGS
ncbi:MAG: TIR domain-containing protein, partial [Deltaproteobacteria bacterium]|nr:TIR domain-containing protein [Deltaproteobacteria bacterium]